MWNGVLWLAVCPSSSSSSPSPSSQSLALNFASPVIQFNIQSNRCWRYIAANFSIYSLYLQMSAKYLVCSHLLHGLELDLICAWSVANKLGDKVKKLLICLAIERIFDLFDLIPFTCTVVYIHSADIFEIWCWDGMWCDVSSKFECLCDDLFTFFFLASIPQKSHLCFIHFMPVMNSNFLF